ncbi:DUF1062 domain-containing protein [Bradyrhizobium lablabi]|uniref:DUF1062 domain-containing protein n=1 Tax=Bradyrhizobium lablabi TaxID=722472 RepID=UPI001BAA4B0B|nr:DUF1062 domain-containing protein [Bradyrhizobium lablabi]MBR1126089.1 DUF1062 domain-containing protein [Bradyrhizobium lablabi]
MCNLLQVRWTLVPRIAPQPWIACRACGGFRPFQSSGKIRLNANGRKLDAWLIYKCTSCEGTWNRTIFERRNVGDIDSATLAALQSNDPHWIRARAFDLEALKRSTHRIDVSADCEVRKELLREAADWKFLEIEFSISVPVSLRLDRLLASELRVSRSQVSALHEAGLLTGTPDRADVLRRRIRDGFRITVDLSGADDRRPTWRSLAVGENVTPGEVEHGCEPESPKAPPAD